MLRTVRPRLSGFIEPCLPSPAPKPPVGAGWIHEIKHDGFRVIAHRNGARVWLLSRNGHDFTGRFAAAAAAVAALPVRSCVLDGEAIVCDGDGLAVFDLIRHGRHDGLVEICAFDLLELDGADLRRHPLEERKAALVRLLRGNTAGVILNQHFEADGAAIFKHACALGCEGIVSKRLGSRYRAGRTGDWLKIKNPDAPAIRRLEDEDWNG
jgi:bifunctional non-homologous end joining protein LigD